MNVLKRWAEVMGDDLFYFLPLAGTDNLALNQELFGNFPFTQQDVLAHCSRCQAGPASAE